MTGVVAALTPLASPSSAMKLIWLIPVLPLAAAAVNLFLGKRLGKGAGGLAVAAMARLLRPCGRRGVATSDGAARGLAPLLHHYFDWIPAGHFNVGVDLRLDTLSATMILVVTGVGLLIHVYAVGYMHGDPRYGRFFAYLNLFVFFMLMLVLGENFLILYLGWEGVGLCSYLLIGFWFEKTENANAAKKAFVTTRIGDTAMLVGIALIVAKFGSLDFTGRLRHGGSTALTKERRRRRSRCCCSPARWASPRRSRCTSGSPTPWPARRRSRR